MRQANYLLSWRATAAIILNTTVLPATDKLLQIKFHMPPRKKDLVLARMSICFFTAGFLALALAPTVAIVIFGKLTSQSVRPKLLKSDSVG